MRGQSLCAMRIDFSCCTSERSMRTSCCSAWFTTSSSFAFFSRLSTQCFFLARHRLAAALCVCVLGGMGGECEKLICVLHQKAALFAELCQICCTCGDNCATIILSSREMRLGRRQQPTCSSQGTLPFSLRGPHRLVSSLVSCRNTVNLMTIICLHTHRTCVSNTNSSQVIGHYTGRLLDILVII